MIAALDTIQQRKLDSMAVKLRCLIFGSGSVNAVRQMQAGNVSKLLELSRIYSSFVSRGTDKYPQTHVPSYACSLYQCRRKKVCVHYVYSSVRAFYIATHRP